MKFTLLFILSLFLVAPLDVYAKDELTLEDLALTQEDVDRAADRIEQERGQREFEREQERNRIPSQAERDIGKIPEKVEVRPTYNEDGKGGIGVKITIPIEGGGILP